MNSLHFKDTIGLCRKYSLRLLFANIESSKIFNQPQIHEGSIIASWCTVFCTFVFKNLQSATNAWRFNYRFLVYGLLYLCSPKDFSYNLNLTSLYWFRKTMAPRQPVSSTTSYHKNHVFSYHKKTTTLFFISTYIWIVHGSMIHMDPKINTKINKWII